MAIVVWECRGALWRWGFSGGRSRGKFARTRAPTVWVTFVFQNFSGRDLPSRLHRPEELSYRNMDKYMYGRKFPLTHLGDRASLLLLRRDLQSTLIVGSAV